MRLKIIAICFVAITAVAAGWMLMPTAAQAESNIAIVNMQKLMDDAKAAVSIQKQLEEQRKSFQEEFSKHERELADEQKKLLEGRADMSAEEFAKKREEFESELLETRKLVQKRQQALEKAASDAINELRMEITKIVADMADKNKYEMVITRQYVILASKDMDITDEVLKQLDKKLKEIKLNVKTN